MVKREKTLRGNSVDMLKTGTCNSNKRDNGCYVAVCGSEAKVACWRTQLLANELWSAETKEDVAALGVSLPGAFE